MILAISNPHAHITRPPRLTTSWGVSFAGHIALLVFLSITAAYSIRTAPPVAIQVRLVGVPQPNAAPKKIEKPEEVRTQDSAAPYEPPKVTKNLPEQTATNKFTVKPETKVEKLPPNPIEAKKRPPVLDKTPREKKVVKNKPDAKVVKNPEDFLKALDYIDQIKAAPNAKPAVTEVNNEAAGEGPQLQLNLSEQGEADAIRRHIEQYWLKPPGVMTGQLEATFLVDVDRGGNLTNVRLTSGSGNDAYDATIQRAIYRAQPLPIPGGKYDTFKQLELHFKG